MRLRSAHLGDRLHYRYEHASEARYAFELGARTLQLRINHLIWARLRNGLVLALVNGVPP